jgi:hypothetical protein
MVAGISKTSFDLELAGKRNALIKLKRENISVTVDVSSITTEGQWSLKCKIALPNTVTSGTVSASEKNNYSINVTIAKQISKTIAIRGSSSRRGRRLSGRRVYSVPPRLSSRDRRIT